MHIQKFDPLYSVDGWLKNIELHGLSSVYLDTVSVNRWADMGYCVLSLWDLLKAHLCLKDKKKYL